MAIKVIRMDGEEIYLTDGYRGLEEHDNLRFYDGHNTMVAKFQTSEVREWWVIDSEEQGARGGE